MTVGPHRKAIMYFQPARTRTIEEATHHYVEVHQRFGRRTQRNLDSVISYHSGTATARYDINGEWNERPRIWMFSTVRFLGEQSVVLSPTSAKVLRDRANYMSELRMLEVAEDVTLDRLTKQTSLAKFVFEFGRSGYGDGGADRDPDGHLFADTGARLTELAEGAFGARLVTINPVLVEGEVVADAEPGQRSTGNALPLSPTTGFIEAYFDHQQWGEEFFAGPEVRELLQDGPAPLLHGHAVTEVCGLDRR